MVEKYGYLADERFVTTEDGYILSVHRVFGSPKSPPSPNKSLVLLVHGMIASSDVWAMRGPRKDLGEYNAVQIRHRRERLSNLSVSVLTLLRNES